MLDPRSWMLDGKGRKRVRRGGVPAWGGSPIPHPPGETGCGMSDMGHQMREVRSKRQDA